MLKLILQIYTWIITRRFHSVGKGTVIKPFLNTCHQEFISLGQDVNVGAFSRLTVATDFGGYHIPSTTPVKLKVGNHVDIGHNAFISIGNDIQIGDHTILSSYVFITDHDHQNNPGTDLHHQPVTSGGFVKIEDNVLIGCKASILKNVTIGRHTTIGANSVVTKDIPPFTIAVGNPAKVIKKYDFKSKKWLSVK